MGRSTPPADIPRQPGPASPEFNRTGLPGPTPRASALAVAHAAPRLSDDPGEMMELPARAVLSRLPSSLAHRVVASDDPTLNLAVPLQSILPQLSRGVVRISFGELRRNAAGLFDSSGEDDSVAVELPLPEILQRLKPGNLQRSRQRRFEVPDDIAPLFGPDGESPRAKSSPAAPAPPPPPAPAPAPAPQEPRTPILPVTQPIPFSAPRATTPAPPPAPTIAPSRTPIQAPLPVSAGALTARLADLMATWPEDLRNQLAASPDATLSLPLDLAEAGLKKGKLRFHWGQIRTWIHPAPIMGSGAVPDDTSLELPLPVMAPLFLPTRKSTAPKKVIIGDNIPDLFSGRRPGSVATENPAPAPVPVPVPALAPAPSPIPAAAAPSLPKPVLDYAEIFGVPGKRMWTPPEIVEQTCKLPGVAGCVMATSDGLLVAGKLPAELSPETVAAFLPQMYAKLAQYTKEMKLGEPTQLTLTVEETPWHIFKTSSLILTVLGRPREPLPKIKLNAIGHRLAQPLTASA